MKLSPLLIPIAIIFGLLGSSFLLCACVGYFIYDETVLAWMPSISIAYTLSLICCICGRKQRKMLIFKRNILITTGLAWLFASIIGSLPYWTLLHCDFSTGIFENVSGITTTGATNLLELENLPKSVLLWRAISQWIGGLGFVTFFITFLGTGALQKQFYVQESTTLEESVSLFHIRRQLFQCFLLYLGLSCACFTCLWLSSMSPWDAIYHALTAISTGGFSNHSDGIPHFHSKRVECVLCIFMFLSGSNFILLSKAILGKDASLLHNAEFKLYVALQILYTFILTVILYPSAYASLPEALRHALFQSLSLSTTAGFHSDNFALWPPITNYILLIVMSIGACTGSTAGGFKILRILALTKTLFIHLEQFFRAHIVRVSRIDKVVWNEKKQLDILYFLALNLLIVIAACLTLQMCMPSLDFLSNISSIIASLSNVGPGLSSLNGPASNFAHFLPSAKLVLALLMLLGRLEIYALIVLFIPKFWKQFD